jgi:hypothetical protein
MNAGNGFITAHAPKIFAEIGQNHIANIAESGHGLRDHQWLSQNRGATIRRAVVIDDRGACCEDGAIELAIRLITHEPTGTSAVVTRRPESRIDSLQVARPNGAGGLAGLRCDGDKRARVQNAQRLAAACTIDDRISTFIANSLAPMP